MKRSKKYKKALKEFDRNKGYTIDEACDILPKISTASFDSSVEIHIKFNISSKQKKTTSIKGSTTLPHSFGSDVKIAVITSPEKIEEAKDADTVGGEELIKKIQGGWMDFDILIATPDMMAKLAILGKVLGPKGKMPNPKNNTVTSKLKEVIGSYKKGKTDFKIDKQGGLHKTIGKVSMKKKELHDNLITFMKAVYQEAKGLNINPFKTIYISPSMGPSIKIDTNQIIKDLTK